jgi:TusA-related sulfurtransferase
MAFELMELKTGNLLGVYSTQAAALRDVADAIHQGGTEAVETLALASDDATNGGVIAEGRALADLVLQSSDAVAV